MGLTKEQWHNKRVNEIIDYVIQHGKKISDNMIYWDTYPVCVKDICVLGVAVKGKVRKKRIRQNLLVRLQQKSRNQWLLFVKKI